MKNVGKFLLLVAVCAGGCSLLDRDSECQCDECVCCEACPDGVCDCDGCNCGECCPKN